MRFDGRRYAETIDGKQLPYKLFEAGCALYNGNTSFDMAYQRSGGIYESVKVERAEIDSDTDKITGQKLLYTNKCKICYPLPENVEIKEAKKSLKQLRISWNRKTVQQSRPPDSGIEKSHGIKWSICN